MATPMTAAEQVKQFQKWQIATTASVKWETHNRNSKGLWGPAHGLMVHHTGSDASYQGDVLYYGRKDLPGPLSQWGISQNGTLYLIGNGRCNHAGLGDPDVLKAVIAENYGSKPPTDNQASVDGNRHFYGVEIWYSGSHGMTASQYTTLLKLGAAVCDFHKWTAKSVIAHGEWQPGKWDPGYKSGTMMDMSAVRSDIQRALSPGTPKPPVVAPKPPTVPVSTTYSVKHGDTIKLPDGTTLKVGK